MNQYNSRPYRCYPVYYICNNNILLHLSDLWYLFHRQTLNMLLLIKCCSFSQKCGKKVTELLFSFFLLCTFYHFCRNESTKGMSKLLSLRHQSTSKQLTHTKSLLFEGCIKWRNFSEKWNFGTHAIVFFLSCFSHKTQISFWWYITIRWWYTADIILNSSMSLYG